MTTDSTTLAPTILVVEDERLLRWSLATQLAAAGFHVLEAGSAAEALAHLDKLASARRAAADVNADDTGNRDDTAIDQAAMLAAVAPIRALLLDYRLPDADGSFPLLEKIQARCPQCVVIMMSAYGTPQVVAEAQARGVRHFLGKPFDINEVVNLVNQLL